MVIRMTSIHAIQPAYLIMTQADINRYLLIKLYNRYTQTTRLLKQETKPSRKQAITSLKCSPKSLDRHFPE